MPVEGFFCFELLGADATLVDEEVGEVDALDVVAHVAPRGLHALADGAHVAPAPALHRRIQHLCKHCPNKYVQRSRSVKQKI